MLKKIKETIKKFNLIEDNKNVIVGFSGGADSAFLLYTLHTLKYNVFAVHVHHGIRGEEADRDVIFAENFCKKYSIPFAVEKTNIPEIAKKENISLETAARQERYKILNNYAKKHDGIIAVAHNKNDQAETVLMHLFRGSGLNGLCGMQYKNKNIIRPILNITRNEIEQFNIENNIEFILDSTNNCLEYSRNKIRLDIIPNIDANLGIDSINSITKCAETLFEYSNFIKYTVEEYAKKFIKIDEDNVILSITSLPHIIQTELIKKAIEYLKGDIVDIEKIHIDDVYLLTEKDSGKEIHLPHNIKAKRIYDKIYFYTAEENFSAEYNFEINKVFKWNNKKISSCFVNEYVDKPDIIHIDGDKMPKNLILRTRKVGDIFYPLGSSGKCTLKKYFIDKKIPSNLRNELPLLAKDNEIYAIIGYTVSEKVKITSETKKIIQVVFDK